MSGTCATSENIRAVVFELTIHSAVKKEGNSEKLKIDVQWKYLEYKQKVLGEGLKRHRFQSLLDERR